MTDAEQIQQEFPACPGDVIVQEDGCRYLVRWAELQRTTERAPCGCCSTEGFKYVVYIEEPFNGPVEAILAGGGTCLVMPIAKWWGDWPPENATVYRDGQAIHPEGGPTAA